VLSPEPAASDEASRFETLLGDLSSQFIRIDARLIDDIINDALKRLGELLDMDRGALTQLGQETLVFTHYWSRTGEPPSYLRVDAARVFPVGLARLMNGDVHSVSRLDDLPSDSPDRDYLAQRNTKSTIAVPLIASGRVIGSIAFATTQRERDWDAETIARLRLVADVIASALARKQAEASLQQAVTDRLEFERLISDLSSEFVNLASDGVDAAIQDAQRRLVESLHVDRSVLFQVSSDEGEFVFTHYWSRPGIAPLTLATADVPAMFPWVRSRILEGEIVHFSTVDELPPGVADREHIRRIGTKSNVTIPLFTAGRVIGALAFGSITSSRDWPPEIRTRLHVIAQVFASALGRKRAEEELRRTLEENARLRERLLQENIYLRDEMRVRDGPSGLTGQSAAIRRVLAEVDQVAPTDATVLLLGETGTGKELIATAIHERSARRARAMVSVNCAAIPNTLVESELFGREKGAYTGAVTRQIGRFEIADGSTLFLDEIGELTLDVQAKLLRVLQEKEVERLGNSRPIKIDVRVIAATNRDLERMVADGSFREDLYYRLNVFPIRVPPLRERPEDIPSLAWSFVDELAKAQGKRIESIANDQILALQRYAWPGNVRELRNVIERAVIVSTGSQLMIQLPRAKTTALRGAVRLEDVERDHIRVVLERTGWRIRGDGGAAQLLDLKPSTLEGRMAKLGLRRPKP
jgi:transcriptional regulator with GAF, ATPase, and Fis domain